MEPLSLWFLENKCLVLALRPKECGIFCDFQGLLDLRINGLILPFEVSLKKNPKKMFHQQILLFLSLLVC